MYGQKVPINSHFIEVKVKIGVQKIPIYFKIQLLDQFERMKSTECKTYAKISLQKRKKLVNLISKDRQSISEAARQVGIKNSTAKLIFRKWRLTGKFFNKKIKTTGQSRIRPIVVEKRSDINIIQTELLPKEEIIPNYTNLMLEPEFYNMQDSIWILPYQFISCYSFF